jgi:hypothetical protein
LPGLPRPRGSWPQLTVGYDRRVIDRLAPFLDRLAHLSVDDLAVLALPEPDPVERAALLQRALDAAEAAGRGDEIRDAPALARDAVVAGFSRRSYEPTWFALNWARSMGRAADRAILLAAIEDAAVGEVVADLLPADDVAALREPFELVASMTGTAPSANPEIRGSRGRRRVVGLTWLVAAAGRVGVILVMLGAILAALLERGSVL